ncbi:flagellar assembly protein FliH [Bacillus sp. FJAT-29953]|nr:flagellar assembly protein FliH [Bacillus sp. FJAT-29953]
MSSNLFKATFISPVIETKYLSLHKGKDTYFPHSDQSAEELLQEAEQRAAEIVLQAQMKAAIEKEHAAEELEKWKLLEQEKVTVQLEEIKQQGFQQGYEEGLQQAHHDYAGRIELAQEVLEKAYEEKKAIIKESEPFVIDLSIQTAAKVIQKELAANPEVLLHLIKQSLLYSNERSSISICVSPDDYEFVQNQRNQILESVEGQVEVKILPEHSIEEGGCVIRTSYGSIDARIDVQLKEIKQALLKTLRDDTYEQAAADHI